MYSHEELLEFHNGAREIKEHVWYEHHEPDLPPILLVRWRDMEPQTVDVGGVGGMIERFRDLLIKRKLPSWLTAGEVTAPLVLWACLGALSDGVAVPGIDEMPPKGTPMEGIWLASEGYGLEPLDEQEAALVQHGDLKRDYETNPESRVVERLMTYQVETSSTGLAEWGRVTSAFHKDDGGRIVWHEPQISTSDDTNLTDGEDGYDRLIDIMTPYVTREKLA